MADVIEPAAKRMLADACRTGTDGATSDMTGLSSGLARQEGQGGGKEEFPARVSSSRGACGGAHGTDDAYVADLARALTGRLGGKVGLAPRLFLKKLVVFPLEGNLCGRSIRNSSPHLFLPGSKGGLYAWEQVRRAPEIILVEGLFDYAELWQAGFRNVTCSMGSHLNARQFQQLCDFHLIAIDICTLSPTLQ